MKPNNDGGELKGQKIKICFASPYIYPLFNSQYKTMFGGFEVQTYQIVKELARRGNFHVSVIVADHGQRHIEIREGVELVSWKGQAIYGIQALTQLVADPSISSQQANIDTSSDQGDANQPETASEDGTSTAGPPVASGKPSRSSTKQRIKRLYKLVIPWRARILIHAFVFGFIEAVIHFARGLRYSLGIWRASTLNGLKIAREAFGDINYQPVFPQDVAIFEEVGADIYAVMGNHWIAARAACYCEKRQRVFVLLVGSDKDLHPVIKDDPAGFDVYNTPNFLKYYAIQHADLMTVQSENQLKLAEYFGLSPAIICNPVDLERKFPKVENTDHILWVGNTQEQVKQPSLMIEVARRLPQFRFTMIVTIVQQEQFDQIVSTAAEIPNLTVLTGIPFEEIDQYFARSRVFVNTSNYEGFPNTFLQAGKYALPIVSLKVDPNYIFTRHHCGILCNDNLETVIENILKLMSDTTFYGPYSRNILEYVRKFHDKEQIITQYESAFQMAFRDK